MTGDTVIFQLLSMAQHLALLEEETAVTSTFSIQQIQPGKLTTSAFKSQIPSLL